MIDVNDLYHTIRNEDVNQYFAGAFFMYANQVVEGIGWIPGGGYRIAVADGTRRPSVPVEFDPTLFQPIRCGLGYVNTEDTDAVYLKRCTVRQYSFGLTRENVVVEPLTNNNNYDLSVIGRRGYLNQLINNEYPSLQQALKLAKELGGSVAFSRNFAVRMDGAIFYKNKSVGGYNGKDIILKDNFKYLKPFIGEFNAKDCQPL